MSKTYQYIDTAGGVKTIQAESSDLAMQNAKDIAARSGVMEVNTNQPMVISSAQGLEYKNSLDKTLTTISGTPMSAQTQQGQQPQNQQQNQKEQQKESNGSVKFIDTNDQVRELKGSALTPEAYKTLQNQGFYAFETSGDVPSWASTGDVEAGKGIYERNNELASLKSDLDEVKSELSQFTISDSQLQSQIQTISSRWDTRIADMERINYQREQSMGTLGVRLGSRWTGGNKGGIFGGIIAEEERQAVKRISDLEAQKQAEISGAREAARQNNWTVYGQKVKSAEEAYKEKVDEVSKLNKLISDNNKKIREQEIEASRDSTIGDLISQGLTDPIQLLNSLNFDEEGNQVGDFTFDEVFNVIDKVQKATKTENLPADIERWKYLKDNGELPENTTFLQFKAMEAAAGRKPEGGGGGEEEDDTKIVNDFHKALGDRNELDDAGTREQFIRQLQARFPQIEPDSVSEWVYATYPDNFNGE